MPIFGPRWYVIVIVIVDGRYAPEGVDAPAARERAGFAPGRVDALRARAGASRHEQRRSTSGLARESEGTSVLDPVQAGPFGCPRDAGSLDWVCGHSQHWFHL